MGIHSCHSIEVCSKWGQSAVSCIYVWYTYVWKPICTKCARDNFVLLCISLSFPYTSFFSSRSEWKMHTQKNQYNNMKAKTSGGLNQTKHSLAHTQNWHLDGRRWRRQLSQPQFLTIYVCRYVCGCAVHTSIYRYNLQWVRQKQLHHHESITCHLKKSHLHCTFEA